MIVLVLTLACIALGVTGVMLATDHLFPVPELSERFDREAHRPRVERIAMMIPGDRG